MLLSYSVGNRKRNTFFVDQACHPQTIACVKTRAEGFAINVVVDDFTNIDFDLHKADLMGVLLQVHSYLFTVLKGSSDVSIRIHMGI